MVYRKRTVKSIDAVWITLWLIFGCPGRQRIVLWFLSLLIMDMPRPAEHRVESFVTPVRQPELTVHVPYACLRSHTHTHTHIHTYYIVYTYCINTTHIIINHWYYHRSIVSIQPKGMSKVIRTKGGASFVSSIRFFIII